MATRFLVADFSVAACIFDREAARLDISTEHDDFFTRNLVAIRYEERLGLGVLVPAAVIRGNFN